MMKPLHFVGLDVGGTTMKAGIVDDSGQVIPIRGKSGPSASHVALPTEAHRGQEFGLKRMCESIDAAILGAGLGRDSIAAIGVATPGTMDIPAGIILDPPNLKPWQNVPVRQFVADEFKVPTAFQNDANAAAYGEFWIGAGKDARSMVLYTLGTGIGGGIVIGDLVLEGEHSHGAELGHVKIEMTNPRQCGCGRWGCLEAYASATSVVKRVLEALQGDGGKSSLHACVRRGEELTSKTIFNAAAERDELAMRIYEETAYYLAIGAMNMMHTIDPDVVVFTGGMIAAGEPFLDRIRHHVRQLAFPVPAAKTAIRYALLGSDAGFIGAAGCGRQLYHRQAQAQRAAT